MKTLYLSDLDGTLFDNSGKLPDTARRDLNQLIGQGILFSAATARSPVSVMHLLEGLQLNVPLVLLNGVFLYDPVAQKAVSHAAIDRESAEKAIQIYQKHDKNPFLFTFDGDRVRYYYTELRTPEQKDFYRVRSHMQPGCFYHLDTLQVPAGQDAIYFTIMDCYDDLKPLRDELEATCRVRTAFYHDTYTKYWFLEVFSAGAGKKNGALVLKAYTGADRICAFGDNLNDLGLFEAADLRAAVSNAVPELKAAADVVIGSNEENGVVQFIAEREMRR